MFHVATCTLETHSPWFLGLAIALCVASFGVAAILLHLLATEKPARRALWLMGLGLVAGGGAWATHFVAMIAYQTPLAITFSPFWTAISIIAGICGAVAAFALLDRLTNLAGAVAAGGVFALAVASLHFAGIKGIEGALRLWNPDALTHAFLVSGALSMLGAGFCQRATSLRGRLLGCLVLVLAVASLHFTAMSALTLAPDPSFLAHPTSLDSTALAIVVAIVVCAILLVVAAIVHSETRVMQARVAGDERMRRLGSAALEGLMMHNGQRIIDANDRFLALVGESLDTVAGSDLTKFASAKTLSYLEAAQGDFAAVEAVLETSSGPREVQLLTRQLEPGLYVTAVRDLAAERRAALAETESRAKSQFLATMSHELRTPLTSIMSYAELIREVAVDENRDSEASDANVILNASKHLLSLISEILDYSKLEAGKLAIQLESFEPAHLLEEIVAEATPLVGQNANQLDFEIFHPLPTLTSDRLRLKQCVLNLVSNAAKFTRDGVISMQARSHEQNGRRGLEITVKDTGIGMSAEVLETLFKPFQQADSSIERRFGGTGLGLAITQQLVTRLEGLIAVQSTEGQGSSFKLWLPNEPASPGIDARLVSKSDTPPRQEAA